MESTAPKSNNPVDTIQQALLEQIDSFAKSERMLEDQLEEVRHNLRRLRRANEGVQPDMPIGGANTIGRSSR